MKLTITQATNYDKKKDGQQILDNRGKQKYRSVIKTVEHGEEFLSGFVYNPLKQGDVVEALIEEEMYNGKKNLKFTLAPRAKEGGNPDILSEMKTHTIVLRAIHEELERITNVLSTNQHIADMKKTPSTPSVDVWIEKGDAEDISEYEEYQAPDEFGAI